MRFAYIQAMITMQITVAPNMEMNFRTENEPVWENGSLVFLLDRNFQGRLIEAGQAGAIRFSQGATERIEIMKTARKNGHMLVYCRTVKSKEDGPC
jgi:hypothetical protein